MSDHQRKPSGAAAVLLGQPADPQVQLAVDLDARERFKARVFDQAVELAVHDDEFRKRLQAKMEGLAEGQTRRRTLAFDVQQVASAVELLKRQYTGTRKAHLVKMPRLFDEVGRLLGITPGKAKTRYYEAQKRGLLNFRL